MNYDNVLNEFDDYIDGVLGGRRLNDEERQEWRDKLHTIWVDGCNEGYAEACEDHA